MKNILLLIILWKWCKNQRLL